jgi:hypothetical protein
MQSKQTDFALREVIANSLMGIVVFVKNKMHNLFEKVHGVLYHAGLAIINRQIKNEQASPAFHTQAGAYRSMCWVCYLPGKIRMADNIGLQTSSHSLPGVFFQILFHELTKLITLNKSAS